MQDMYLYGFWLVDKWKANQDAIRHFRVLLCLCFKTSLTAKHMKMSSVYSFILMQIKGIFIRMVSHLDLLWNRATREPPPHGHLINTSLVIMAAVFCPGVSYNHILKSHPVSSLCLYPVYAATQISYVHPWMKLNVILIISTFRCRY